MIINVYQDAFSICKVPDPSVIDLSQEMVFVGKTKSEISYMLHKFLLREDSEEAKYACERFCEVILIFKDEREKDDFVSFIYGKKEEMIKRVEQIPEEYGWIEAENKRSRDEIIKRLKAGRVLNEMLVEFRNDYSHV